MDHNLLFHWEGSRPKMAEYRAYILGSDDRIRKAVDLFCPDDEVAKEKAKQLVNGHDVELWQLGRKVETFKRTQE
jgi:hypothetical protein